MFRESSKSEHNEIMKAHFFFKLELYCNGRALFDSNRTEFPLHKAVFENNLPLISRLINCTSEGHFFQNKNEIDACGNTPLILAVKLGQLDVVKVLSDWFTCPKLKSFSNCNHNVFHNSNLLYRPMCDRYCKCFEEQRNS